MATSDQRSRNLVDANDLADQEWRMVQSEGLQNEELIGLSREILDLTEAIHELTLAHTSTSGDTRSDPS